MIGIECKIIEADQDWKIFGHKAHHLLHHHHQWSVQRSWWWCCSTPVLMNHDQWIILEKQLDHSALGAATSRA